LLTLAHPADSPHHKRRNNQSSCPAGSHAVPPGQPVAALIDETLAHQEDGRRL
jgi:hypothetical protein